MIRLTQQEMSSFLQAIPVTCSAVDLAPLVYCREAFDEWQAQVQIAACIDVYKARMGMVQTAGRA